MNDHTPCALDARWDILLDEPRARRQLPSTMNRLVLTALALASVACAQTTATTAASSPATSSGAAESAALSSVLAMPHRSAANRARDAHRHPAATLAFFGVQPTMTVLELSPGGGWYTEILAPYLRGRGQLVAAVPPTDSSSEFRRGMATAFRQQLSERAAVYGEVRLVTLDPPATIELGPDASVDAVLTFRNLHNWYKDERLDQVIAAAFRVLKPGGVFGVVEHRAPVDSALERINTTGYVPQAWAIERITAAGFVLEAQSELNANPRDTRDHANGVWSLPPTYRGGDVDRARFEAIGESDRMTLRFRKPR
jgi:predicted methyltransferase